ncbi:MAG: hypothetical protein M0Q99_10960 [Candidatus Cloacimonetes bacterium]|nr:hypothetical protein [Candidatus Cloacimonadota bacterium]
MKNNKLIRGICAVFYKSTAFLTAKSAQLFHPHPNLAKDGFLWDIGD